MSSERDGLSESFVQQLSRLRHDMRTPIGHVLGYAEMLEEDLEEGASSVTFRRAPRLASVVEMIRSDAPFWP